MKKQETVYLLRNPKLANKFCQKRDKEYGCKEAFGCTSVCPFYDAMQTEQLMNEKNLSLGDAMRLGRRRSFSEDEARKIIREAVTKTKPQYPK